MSDKMTIVGIDGSPKYELTEDNKVVDLQHCICIQDAAIYHPYQINGTEKICLICNKPILEENHG